MTKNKQLLEALLVLVLVASIAPTGMGVARASAPWDADPLWDDGRAEFSAYEVEWPRYGRIYRGRALMTLVKEPWAPDLEVKAERSRPDSFPVLKLNHQRTVTTGIYGYTQMSSLYWPVGRPLRKLQATHLDSCGQSTARLIKGELETRSYFDGDGDRSMSYPATALAADGLAKTLRSFVTGAIPSTVEVVPSLMRGRFRAISATPIEFSLHRGPTTQHTVPAGTYDAVRLTLEAAGRRDVYFFEARTPHRLLEMRLADGTNYRLAKSERLAYWAMSDPSFEGWWPASLR